MYSATESVARIAKSPEPLSKSQKRQSKYTPPPETGTTQLLEVLADSPRLPVLEQNDLLDGLVRPDQSADLELYFAGDLSLLKRPCVAIVGTRQVSDCGIARTKRLAHSLAKAGIVVVSGLAKGVDAAAHRAAIEAGGSTIAVIGTPLDKAYPAENAALQEQIYRKHLVITREPTGARTYRSSFPQRNKLMAVLTDATVVIEASDTSGTLHQSVECTKLGRWLFIAKSVVDDQSLTWPKKFLKHDTCIVLTEVSDVTERILKQHE